MFAFIEIPFVMCAATSRHNRKGNQAAIPERIEGRALSALLLSSCLLNARHFAEGEASRPCL